MAVPRLRQPDLKLRQTKVEGITVNPEAMADDLENLGGKLRTAQKEFRRQRRVVQATRRKKNQWIQDHHRHNIVWTARTVEGYYRLAGEDELADRLRPIIRRVSRPQPPEPPASPIPEETSPESPTPDDGTPDDGLPNDGNPDEPPPEEAEDEGSPSESFVETRTASSTP